MHEEISASHHLKLITKMEKADKVLQEANKEKHEHMQKAAHAEEQKLHRAKINLDEINRQNKEYRKKIEQNIEQKMSRKLTHSMTAPQGLKDLIPKQGFNSTSNKTIRGDDDQQLKSETKRLKMVNFEENLKREIGKHQFKKIQILSKE